MGVYPMWKTLVALLCAGGLQAQAWYDDLPGYCVSLDFSEDGCDDLVVVSDKAIYAFRGRNFGDRILDAESRRSTYLLPVGFVAGIPVAQGRSIFIPCVEKSAQVPRRHGCIVELELFGEQGELQETYHHWIPTRPGYDTEIYSLVLDSYHGHPDQILAAWVEGERRHVWRRLDDQMHVAQFNTDFQQFERVVTLHEHDRPKYITLCDISPMYSPWGQADEYLLTYCGIGAQDGIGFQLFRHGFQSGMGRWEPSFPVYSGALSDRVDNIGVGRFPFRFGISTVVMQWRWGIGILSIDTVEPFVQPRSGELITRGDINGFTRLLPGTIQDYDGDGYDEIVCVAPIWIGLNWSLCAVVCPPSSRRTWAQVIPLYTLPTFAHHSCTGDFDGDGDQDVAICAMQPPYLRTPVFVLRNTGQSHQPLERNL